MQLSQRSKRWLRDGLLLFFVLVAIQAFQRRGLVTGSAPAFALSSLAGPIVSRDDLRGKPTMLVFWAPWCGVCRASSGNVSWLKSLLEHDANVVSIASQYENLAQVQAYVTQQAVDYPVLLDDAGAARRFGVSAYPTLLFLDQNGDIQASSVGYTTTFGMYLRLQFARIVGG